VSSRRASGGGLRHPWLIAGALTAVVAAAIVVVVAMAAGGGGDRPDYPYDVQTFEEQGREHLPVGQTYDFYNSAPPTTGPHAPAPAPWGVSDAALPKEVPVHNMEHGGIVIWYNCQAASPPLDEAACRALRDQLAAVTEEAIDDGKQVLMLPYPDMDVAIALTAWRTLDTLDAFDGERVKAFIAAYDRAFNPENF
jgi:hypothetical protein